jgi:AraC-like DNA-binding protein
MIDPESDLSRKLISKYLDKNDIVPLSVEINIEPVKQYFDYPTPENAAKVYTSIINSLDNKDDIKIQKDQRIIDAVNYIKNLEVKKASTKEIAAYVGLSEGRLIHLFKEQVGIPIRRYLIWRRISDAVEMLISGKSPTCAAHEAEFADYAHLSRNFTSMFGHSVTDALKYINFHTL